MVVDAGASSHVLPRKYLHLASSYKNGTPTQIQVVGGVVNTATRADFRIKNNTCYILELNNALVLDTGTPLISFGRSIELGIDMKIKDKLLHFENNKEVIL
eukprot:snap_masked-scaffold_103-processed-gene-0.26-mRNA-1 protein AED:1.00 eAED:1.00 QI:0/-1/0/0/-1/1/1/0/100